MQIASSIAIAAPCAMYYTIGCAASPSSVAGPMLQLSTGSRCMMTKRQKRLGSRSTRAGISQASVIMSQSG